MATDLRVILALVLALSLAEPLHASSRGIHYGAVTDPDVLACDRQQWQGETDVARQCYADLMRTSDSLAARAEAAWALNDLQAANTFFQQAMALR